MIMRISSAAVDLVASVELHAHKPSNLVRSEIGDAEIDVEATIASLEHSGAVIKSPFLDAFRLGFTPYTVGFQIVEDFVADKYVPLVVRAEQVAWLRRHCAAGEFSMGVIGASLADVIELFDDLLIGFRRTVIRRYFLVVESYLFFGHKELTAAPIERVPLRASATHRIAELDDLDRRVVAALIPRRHFDPASVGHELRITPQQLEARIERLRRLEVIGGFTYRFEPAAVRRRRFGVFVRRRTTDLRMKRRFIEFSEIHRYVCAVVNFLGEWDHELIVDVPSEHDVVRFVGELRRAFHGEIGRVWWYEQAEELKSTNLFGV